MLKVLQGTIGYMPIKNLFALQPKITVCKDQNSVNLFVIQCAMVVNNVLVYFVLSISEPQ